MKNKSNFKEMRNLEEDDKIIMEKEEAKEEKHQSRIHKQNSE